MACGCAKRRYSADDPLIVGEPNGEPARRIRFTVAFMGQASGSEQWVTGDGVNQMIDNNWFLLL